MKYIFFLLSFLLSITIAHAQETPSSNDTIYVLNPRFISVDTIYGNILQAKQEIDGIGRSLAAKGFEVLDIRITSLPVEETRSEIFFRLGALQTEIDIYQAMRFGDVYNDKNDRFGQKNLDQEEIFLLNPKLQTVRSVSENAAEALKEMYGIGVTLITKGLRILNVRAVHLPHGETRSEIFFTVTDHRHLHEATRFGTVALDTTERYRRILSCPDLF